MSTSTGANAGIPAGPDPALSLLDLVPVPAGRSRAAALRDMVELAQAAEAAGYHRYWLAEHHGSATYLASATTVLMGQVLAATDQIGVASGGIMLPNHAPLVIAEQIGTLATLYPGRVALGLGRAPGTDPMTAAALRRREADADRFAQEVRETLGYLSAPPSASTVPGSLRPPEGSAPTASTVSTASAARAATTGTFAQVRAIPGEGACPLTWVLGSSVSGARVAGSLGLPFAVASHFAPAQAEAALATYRSVLAGSGRGARPRCAAGVNVMVAPSAQEAEHLFSTAMAACARIVGGQPGPLDPPGAPGAWRELAGGRHALVEQAMSLSCVGTPDQVASQLRDLTQAWGLDEVLVVTYAHDPALRRRSYELLAQAWFGR